MKPYHTVWVRGSHIWDRCRYICVRCRHSCVLKTFRIEFWRSPILVFIWFCIVSIRIYMVFIWFEMVFIWFYMVCMLCLSKYLSLWLSLLSLFWRWGLIFPISRFFLTSNILPHFERSRSGNTLIVVKKDIGKMRSHFQKNDSNDNN